jgi:hypothetical protein
MIEIVPDTNVLLHARKLVSLPWEEIDPVELRIAIVGPTLREIDKHKTKPGRVGRRARDISAELREILKLPERTKTLREASPRVTISVVPGLDVRTRLHDSLDLDHPDHALVNHALARATNGAAVRLLTDDTFASLVAEEAGLETIMLPDHWALEPEADEIAKKLKQAQAEIEALKKLEPQVTAIVRAGGEEPVERLEATVRRYTPLDRAQIQQLVDRAAALCPPATHFGPKTVEEAIAEDQRVQKLQPATMLDAIAKLASVGVVKHAFKPASEEEIATYRDKAYPGWLKQLETDLAKLHLSLDSCASWPEFRLSLVNGGTRPAENTLIEILALGDIRVGRVAPPAKDDQKFSWSLPAPPKPPVGGMFKQNWFGGSAGAEYLAGLKMPHIGAPLLARDLLEPPDPTKFSWFPKQGVSGPKVEAWCKAWRHQSDERTATLFVDTERTSGFARGAVEVRIGAHNISKPIIVTVRVEVSIDRGDTLGVATLLVDDLAKAS